MLLVNKLLIDHSPGQLRVAALSNSKLLEIYFDSPMIPNVNSIYLGRVIKELHSVRGIFIDLGFDKPGFLSNAKRKFVEGELIFVKIIQPPRKGKGAKVSPMVSNNKSLKIDDYVDKKLPHRISISESLISRCCNMYISTLDEIIIASYQNSNEIINDIKNTFKGKIINTKDDIFFNYGVEETIEHLMHPRVLLKEGASITIDEAEAFTAIDIDSGLASARDANFLALKELAVQLRLRAIGGAIIVDLIPCDNRQELKKYFTTLIGDDPTETRINGFTPGGRLEINRRRIRPSTSEILFHRDNDFHFSSRTIALSALRKCIKIAMSEGFVNIGINAHKIVINTLNNELRYALNQAENIIKGKIKLKISDKDNVTDFNIITG